MPKSNNPFDLPQAKPRQKGSDSSRKSKQPAAAGPSRSSAPAAQAQSVRTNQPRIVARTALSCRVRHRELVSPVTGSVAFTVLNGNIGYPLNPGVSTTFPWLSIMAQGWEQYTFHSLSFEYYTRTGSTTPGSFIMAPDYDAGDFAPVSEQIACSYAGAVEDVPWVIKRRCDLNPVAMKGGMARKYTRNASSNVSITSSDIKTYDSGTMYACTVDGTAVPWGKLWVVYDVEFFVPQSPNTGLVQAFSQHLKFASVVSSAPLNAPVSQTGSAIMFITSGSGVFLACVLPGRYAVTVRWSAATTVTDGGLTLGGGAALVTSFWTAGSVVSGSGTAGLTFTFVADFPLSSVFGFTETIVGACSAEMTISTINPNLT